VGVLSGKLSTWRSDPLEVAQLSTRLVTCSVFLTFESIRAIAPCLPTKSNEQDFPHLIELCFFIATGAHPSFSF
jgi:hypothetical protein